MSRIKVTVTLNLWPVFNIGVSITQCVENYGNVSYKWQLDCFLVLRFFENCDWFDRLFCMTKTSNEAAILTNNLILQVKAIVVSLHFY